MGLKDLKFGSETIETPGGNFTVRGINVEDIRAIMRDNTLDIAALVQKSAELPADEKGNADYMSVFAQAIHIAPRLVAHVIARAADEGDDEDAIKAVFKLPIDVQIIAIDRIGQLTFASEGGLKKVIEIVIRIAQGATSLSEGLQPSKNGSVASIGK